MMSGYDQGLKRKRGREEDDLEHQTKRANIGHSRPLPPYVLPPPPPVTAPAPAFAAIPSHRWQFSTAPPPVPQSINNVPIYPVPQQAAQPVSYQAPKTQETHIPKPAPKQAAPTVFQTAMDLFQILFPPYW